MNTNQIRHKWQETGYSCGAAACAMILGITETEARKLAGTTRTGTSLHGAAGALRTSGYPVHVIHTDSLPLSLIGWALETQSQRWPLWLHLAFPEKRVGRTGRKFKRSREHAVVLWRGNVYDPGEWDTLTVDALGHLADGEILLRSYILVETP